MFFYVTLGLKEIFKRKKFTHSKRANQCFSLRSEFCNAPQRPLQNPSPLAPQPRPLWLQPLTRGLCSGRCVLHGLPVTGFFHCAFPDPSDGPRSSPRGPSLDRTDSWMVRNAAATNIRVRRARARRGVGLLQPGWLPRPRQCSLHDWTQKGPHWGCCCPVTKDVSGVSRALWTKPLPIFTWADVPSILHCKSPAETQVLSHRPWGPQRHGVSRFAEARFARSPSAAPACGARGDAPRLLPGGLRPQLSRSSLQLALKNRARVQPRACRKRPPVGAPQAVSPPRARPPSQ